MAPRSLASVKLSFGLVTIPVNIYTAGESKAKVSFNWLHKKCGGRLKMQYHCPTDKEVVDAADKIKGYEFQKGDYVLFSKEELKALEAKSTQSIDIEEFIPASKVDRIYLDKIYYLGPDKGGDKAYHLLSEALKKTKRAALARYAARGKMYLVLIRPEGKGLVMEQLHYKDEIKPFSEIALGSPKVTPNELKLAVQIIEQGKSEKFQPEKYEDEVRMKTLEAIQAKVDGEDITQTEMPAQKKVLDLMEALKQSLDHGGTSKKAVLKQAKEHAKGKKSDKGVA